MTVEHRILVAPPNMHSDMFSRTIVYVLDHNQYGASGFILNRGTGVGLREISDVVGVDIDSPRELYRGGPVESNALYVLHSSEWYGSPAQQAVGNGLCVSSDDSAFERLSWDPQPAYYKVLAGVCGWAPGQLERELDGSAPYANGSGWLVMDYADRWVFNAEDQTRVWQRALETATQQAVQSFF